MTDNSERDEGTSRPGYVALGDAQPLEPELSSATCPFHTVVIGASAGGVEAVMRLFGTVPADSGCAFLVVMHLSPDRESLLHSLIGRTTTMPVAQAVDDTPLQPDHVYIAPPGQFLEISRGRIVLLPMGPRVAKPVGVDHCMVSVSADQRDHAIGVVLTGLDSDGTLGIKAIKAEGGLTIAQHPGEAAHPDMPRNALATGLVDCELAVDEMAAAIVDYVAAQRQRHSANEAHIDSAGDEVALREILDVIRAQLGTDFRGYKPAMLLRRVGRRMGLTRTVTMPAYARRLPEDPDEVRALAEDFLISVTEFFREPESWSALVDDVLPALLADKRVGDGVRVWVPACATGEEAYSIAMVLLENPIVRERGLKIQVFATDIDEVALDVARKGFYPNAIEHTVAKPRLKAFFVKSGSPQHYQVSKALRETVMFASQNLVNDPPFSRMDLVSCRNLLIYMGSELQARLMQVFHFALEPGGALALGKSETIGAQTALFAPATQRAHIYRRIGPARPLPIVAAPQPAWRREDKGHPRPVGAANAVDYGRMARDALLHQRAAAAVVTNREGQALYFYGPVHAYLAPPEGAPTNDLFAMLRDELRPQLRAAIHRAGSGRQSAETIASMHVADQGEQVVRAVVAPLEGDPHADLLLVTFERQPREAASGGVAMPADAATLRTLEDELRSTKRELRAAIEELESANEELKVANEEAMSMNEELQSANEELETSKEELQSVNEELTTVNQQLEEKVGELEVLNNDLGNLLTSTHIPTLFLDRQLRIKRFTPAATALFPLLPGDLNRPLSDIAGPNDLASLLEDARQVLATLSPVERETRSLADACYLRRTLPYRTQEDRIEGVVVTFADITELKRAGEGMRRHAVVMQTSNDAVIVHDVAGRIQMWNRGAETLYGYSEAEMIGADVHAILPSGERHARAHARLVKRLLEGERLHGTEGCRKRRDGVLLDVSISSSVVRDEAGQPVAVALIERDITPQKHAEHELRESERRFRALADSAPALIWIADENGAIEFVNKEFSRATGLAPAQLVGRWWVDLLHRDDAPGITTAIDRARGASTTSTRSRVSATARLNGVDGEPSWMKITLMPRAAAGDEPSLRGIVGTMVDIDAQIRAEQELRVASQHKDEFLAMLGHELRNPLVPIRNAAEVLGHVASDDARVTWVRSTLVRQVGHVTRLVDDLLDISLITRKTMRLHLEPIDIGFAIERALEATAPMMRRKRHAVDIALPAERLWVEGDAIRMTQVFENLLANAAKYTEDGGTLRIAMTVDGGDAAIEVSDNGMGLDPRVVNRIFDLFVQDHRSIDRSQGGMGIGLALVRHLVELHRGTIEAFSDGVDRGSRFVVRLPLLPTPPAPPPASAMADGAGAHVMIVDDDIEGAESLAMLLRLYGYAVEHASTLEEAQGMARRSRPRVVILDIAMPGADGYEVAERLRAMPEMQGGVTYLALSGFGQPSDFARSAEAGFARHLVKPVDPTVLHALLQRALKA